MAAIPIFLTRDDAAGFAPMGKPKPKIGMAAISKDPSTGMIREGCDIGTKPAPHTLHTNH